MKDSIIADKSYQFSIRIVNLHKYLINEKNEFVLSKQILRSGTAVGALVSEAKFAQSTADFINKFSIALKEANETSYWLKLLKDTEFIDEKMFNSLYEDSEELIKILVTIIKTSKRSKS